MNADSMFHTPARVLLVDSQPVMLQALHDTLAATGLFAVIHQAGSASQALSVLAADPGIGLVIIDPAAGGGPAAAAIATLRTCHPEVLLVVFSADDSHRSITSAFAAGVRGYITKDLPSGVVNGAVRLVLSGQVYLPPALLSPASFDLPVAAPVTAMLPAATERMLASLTPRQQEVLQCLMLGAPNKVIARRLGIAEGTVKAHLNTIFRVVGAATRTQTVLRLREYGLV